MQWDSRHQSNSRRPGVRMRLARAARTYPAYVFVPSGFLVIALLVAIIGALSYLSTENMLTNPGRLTTHNTDSSTGSVLLGGASKEEIALENSNNGTYNWIIAPKRMASTQIQAYASATAVEPGQKLVFYVSVQKDGTPYTIDFYRLGWYGRAGGRILLTVPAVGRAQGYYDQSSHTLVNCPSCLIDPSTRLIDANWKPSYALNIPVSWVTGIYEAKFTDDSGMETYVTFDVTGNAYSTYLAITADTTEAAYNQWGGYSLNQGPDGSYQTRAFKVSLNRPTAGVGTAQGLNYEIDTVRWLENYGYDVAYTSLTNVHQHPELLLTHKAILFLGHNEYWSKSVRDGAEAARDAGVGLAFLSADDAAWQIRFDPASDTTPDRTIVCYKSAALDPLNGVDNARVTVNWRSAPVSRPENALIGIMYSALSKSPPGFQWWLNPSASSPLLADTALSAGRGYGCDIVGYEWDRIFNNGNTPPGLVELGASPTVISNGPDESSSSASNAGVHDVSNTTYYVAPSGAMVFASGSIFWSYALDSFRFAPHPECASATAPLPGIQKLMQNVMAALVVNQKAS